MRITSLPLSSLVLGIGAILASPAIAQDYPSSDRTLTINVPWSAGGGTDAVARLLQPGLEKELGISVEVINQPGGGSQAGLSRCVNERPDGYTLCASNLPSTNMTYLIADRGAPYTRDSFKPVATIAFEFGSVIVKKDSPYKTIEDVVEDAHARPGEIRVGNAGRYTNAHIDLLAFQRATKAEFAPVFFNGGAPAITALLGGHVDVVTSTPSNFMGQVQSGDIRVLGLMSDEESPLLPGVPTVASFGYDAVGFTTRTFSTPSGVSDEIVAKLSDAILAAAATDTFKEALARLGADARAMDAQATAALWNKVDNDIKEHLASMQE